MFRRPRTLRAATTLMAGAALALAGCLVPDDYELTVKVKDDMTFASTFEGDLINALARKAEIKGESDGAVAEHMREAAVALREEDTVDAVARDGAIRFTVSEHRQGAITAQPKKLTVGGMTGTIRTAQADGRQTVVIRGTRISEGNRDALARADIASAGTIEVCTDLEVLAHNATSTPNGILSSVTPWGDCYSWTIENYIAREKIPYIRLAAASTG